MLLKNIAERARQNACAAIHQSNPVCQPFNQRELMRAEQYGCAHVLQRQEKVNDALLVNGIKPRKRLIHNDEPGFVRHRRDQLYFLLIAF